MIWLEVERNHSASLTHQLYDQIREKILCGELKAGNLLPSSRALSNHLKVSRNVILNAYDMLFSEGYVESIPGSGTYVANGTYYPLKQQAIQDNRTTALGYDRINNNIIDFSPGTPDLDLFPRKKWMNVLRQILLDMPSSALGYDSPEGRPELRYVLADYLDKTRSIKCSPEQIVITSGSKQSLTLIAKCLLDSESNVILENPTNKHVIKIFSYHTSRIFPVAVDEKGIQTECLPQDINPKLIFVTPSNQYPLGGTLPIQRRIDLVRFAEENRCYIIEDDYDSEFQYENRPIRSLKALSPEHVVYIGTFSKVLMPSLRLGYIVLPQSLIPQFREWKWLADHNANTLNQLAVLRFIEEGSLENHIKTMKKIYLKRRNQLLECLNTYFGDDVILHGKSAGMHIVAEFPEISFTPSKLNQFKTAGINIIPVSSHTLDKKSHTNQIILGYAHLREEQIAEGIHRLKEALNG